MPLVRPGMNSDTTGTGLKADPAGVAYIRNADMPSIPEQCDFVQVDAQHGHNRISRRENTRPRCYGSRLARLIVDALTYRLLGALVYSNRAVRRHTPSAL
jgi:hypothetical protein